MSETKQSSKQVRTYQPTYQLNPRKRFSEEKVQKILKDLVDTELAEAEYSEKTVPELTLNLAETVKNAIKEENFNRYLCHKLHQDVTLICHRTIRKQCSAMHKTRKITNTMHIA